MPKRCFQCNQMTEDYELYEDRNGKEIAFHKEGLCPQEKLWVK